MEQTKPYNPFLALLSTSPNAEDPVPLLASALLTSLVPLSLTKSPKPLDRDNEALQRLFDYFSMLSKNQDSGLQDIGVQGFSTSLRTKKSRQIFWNQRQETVEPLFETLRTAAGTGKDSESTTRSGATSVRSAETSIGGGVGLQLLYHVLLVIWQLSFEGQLVGDELERLGGVNHGEQFDANCLALEAMI